MRAAGVFERRFPNYELLYSGWDSGDSLETACADLARQGAQLILPALSELLPFVPGTGPVPVLDPHRIYVEVDRLPLHIYENVLLALFEAPFNRTYRPHDYFLQFHIFLLQLEFGKAKQLVWSF